MRCPRCGARNPESADWCGQCYAELRPAPPPPTTSDRPVADQPSPAPDARVRPPLGDDRATVPEDDREPVVASSGRFRRVGDEHEWRCVICESWNPVGLTRCAVCATPFGRTAGDTGDELEPLREVDPGTAAFLSVLLPGAGHVQLGRRAIGIARAAMYLLWLLGGFALLRSAAASGGSMLPGLLLLVAAAALWLVSIHDAYQLASVGRGELLTPRIFFWGVTVVVGLLILTFIPALMQATTQVPDEGAPATVVRTVTQPPTVEPTTAAPSPSAPAVIAPSPSPHQPG